MSTNSITVYPAASTDTGFANNNTEYYPTGYYSNYCSIGRYSSAVTSRSWIRLALTGLPAGVTITSAVLTLTAQATLSGATCSVLIGASDADNPSYPASAEIAMALTLMADTVVWPLGAWVNDSTYSVDITSIIQGIVNRSDYTEGEHALLFIDDNGSSSAAYRRFSTYTYNSNTEKPALTVSYVVDSTTEATVATAAAAWTTQTASVTVAAVVSLGTTSGAWAVNAGTVVEASSAATGTVALTISPQAATVIVQETSETTVSVETVDIALAAQTAIAAVSVTVACTIAAMGTWGAQPATVTTAQTVATETAAMTTALPGAECLPRITAEMEAQWIDFAIQPIAGTTCKATASVQATALRLAMGVGLGTPHGSGDVAIQALTLAIGPATANLAGTASASTARANFAVQSVSAGLGRYAIWRYASPLPVATRFRAALPQRTRFTTRVTLEQP